MSERLGDKFRNECPVIRLIVWLPWLANANVIDKITTSAAAAASASAD